MEAFRPIICIWLRTFGVLIFSSIEVCYDRVYKNTGILNYWDGEVGNTDKLEQATSHQRNSSYTNNQIKLMKSYVETICVDKSKNCIGKSLEISWYICFPNQKKKCHPSVYKEISHWTPP